MQPSFFDEDEDEVFPGLSDMIVVHLVGVHISRRPFVPKSPGVSWGMGWGIRRWALCPAASLRLEPRLIDDGDGHLQASPRRRIILYRVSYRQNPNRCYHISHGISESPTWGHGVAV